jgi:hypothetical protein
MRLRDRRGLAASNSKAKKTDAFYESSGPNRIADRCLSTNTAI